MYRRWCYQAQLLDGEPEPSFVMLQTLCHNHRNHKALQHGLVNSKWHAAKLTRKKYVRVISSRGCTRAPTDVWPNTYEAPPRHSTGTLEARHREMEHGENDQRHYHSFNNQQPGNPSVILDLDARARSHQIGHRASLSVTNGNERAGSCSIAG